MQPSNHRVPSGKLTVCYGKSPFLIGKSTISMAIFNRNVCLLESNPWDIQERPADLRIEFPNCS